MTARSPRGTGSVKPNANGSWRIVVSLPPDPVTGKRRQLVRTVRGSKTQARTALNALLAERGSGRLDGSSITVGGLVAEWLDHDTELSPTTRADYERVRQWLQGPFGLKPASKVTVAEVRDLYRHLAEQGVTAWRVQRLHEVLRRAFNLGVRWEWLTRNPVALASPPAPRRKDRPAPSDADVLLLLSAVSYDFATWLRVAAATGARRGEVCGLQWDDIAIERIDGTNMTAVRAGAQAGMVRPAAGAPDGKPEAALVSGPDRYAGTLHIQRAVVYTPASGVTTKGTKTGRGRVLAIDDTTCRMLLAHRLTCAERARVGGWKLADDAFVFSSAIDGSTPWRPDRPTQRFIRLRDSLGLDLQLKDLRHSSVTYLLDAGIAPNSVADRHGHATTSMTLDVYGHAVPVRDRQMAELVGRRLDAGR